MSRNRWLRPLITTASIASGLVGGFALAFVLWSVLVDQNPESEAGAVGLIWLFCLFTVPLAIAAIRSMLLRIFRIRK